MVGGVLSGLGKGVVSASIGLLLKSRGFDVTAVKIDPYVSIDAGTMRPAEHGEVFVTHDGGEIDQDLGHYERFINTTLTKNHNITTGKVFQSVIDKERHFFYKGRDAELIPDVVNEIKEQIYASAKGHEFCVLEIGGTTGDLENMPFLHAAREMGRDYKTIYIMVTYLPFLKNTGELKTKPTQHAVARLREIGIMPDFIVTRNEIPIDEPRIETISKRCFVKEENIVDDPDRDLVYEVPIMFEDGDFAEKILKHFRLRERAKRNGMMGWRKFVKNIKNTKKEISIALVGKYVTHGSDKHKDVYISVLEALTHAGSYHKTKVNIEGIDSGALEKMNKKAIEKKLSQYDGIVAPQGWGSRGTEGKIKAIEYARKKNVPYLGLCFGMQMACLEFARNVVGLKGANSQEINPKTKHPIIHIMPDQKEYLKKKKYGGTIRLGAWPCVVRKGTKLFGIYKKYGKDKSSPWHAPREGKKTKNIKSGKLIWERHRHRYEFNNEYKGDFEKKGFVFSGTSPDGKLVEAIEIKDHPFFVATQFHPEYISRPLSPHPIFLEYVKSVSENI